MTPLGLLLLPAAASAVAVLAAVLVLWTVLPHHRGDWSRLPDEETTLADLRSRGLSPGMYFFPHAASAAELQSDAFRDRVRRGPAGLLILQTPEARLGRRAALLQAFGLYLALGLLVAVLAAGALAPGAEWPRVAWVTGLAGVLAHAGAVPPKAIFYGFRWSVVWREVVDGIVAGMLTGIVFTWLWPPA